MRQLRIVSHIPSANTQRLTEAVLAGARAPSVKNVDVRFSPPAAPAAGRHCPVASQPE